MSQEETTQTTPEAVEIPSVEDQKKLVKPIYDDLYEKGSKWTLIEWNWWISWKQYVAFDVTDDEEIDEGFTHPGQIDNSSLLDDDGKLLPERMLHTHCEVIPMKVWDLLVKWYGGGPSIEREMVEMGDNKTPTVEIYPLNLVLTKAQKKYPITISKTALGSELAGVIADLLSFDKEKTEVRFNTGDSRWQVMKDKNAQLDDIGLVDGCLLFAHESRAHTGAGNRPSYVSSTSRSSYSSNHGRMTVSRNTKPKNSLIEGSNGTIGVVGLRNLGNTCFMNSALQCLSNTSNLTSYFISKKYLEEINRTNVLGLKGKLAEEYGTLINEMWADKYSVIAPSSFKWAIGKFATQFHGYRQHDSQELIAFLIDGLHEDLNRVVDKPYVETPDQDETISDSQLAAEAWERHLQRNKSIIVDLFQAQLKSTVTCPECSFVSRTFDPVMYLTLPLPTTNDITITIIYVPNEITEDNPRRAFEVEIPKRAKVSEIIEAFREVAGLTCNVVLTEIQRNTITRRLDARSMLYNIPRESLYAFEEPEHEEDDNYVEIHVIHRTARKKTSTMTYHTGYTLIGTPFVVPHFYTEELHQSDVYNTVIEKIRSKVKKTEEGEEDPYELKIGTNAHDSRAKEIDLETNEIVSINKHQKKICVLVNWEDAELYDEEQDKIDYTNIGAGDEEEDDDRITLKNCMDLFTQEERLGKGDEWYCPKCKDHHQAAKKFSLWTTPTYLIVHLKRFSQGRSAYSSTSKIDTHVHYPLEGLDLRDYIENEQFVTEVDPLYDLYAVSVHSGGLGGGHYTAYGKNPEDNLWYSFNDSSTSHVSESRVQTSGAYLLFYQLRGTENKIAEAVAISKSLENAKNEKEETKTSE